MKKTLIGGILVLGLVAAPLAASAASIQTGSRYFSPAGDVVNGNLYVASGNATVAGTVNGDLYLAAGTATITGEIKGDLVIAGGTVTVTGPVDGDLRIFGGNVAVTGPVRGDVFVIGGSLAESSTVGGDFDFTGGMLTVDAGAVINGHLVYRSNTEARISPQAVIHGPVVYDRTLARSIGIVKEAGTKSFFSGLAALFGVWLFLALLMYIFAALVLFWLFRPYLEAVVTRSLHSPGRSLGIGFITLIVTPVLAVILMVTFIGLPLGILLGLVYVVAVALAKIATGAVLGAWGEKVITKRGSYRLTWWGVVIGTIVLFALAYVPIIGWLVDGLVFLITFGALADLIYRHWLAR